MKIVYSAGDRTGSDSQLVRFLEHASNKHEIKIAAYFKSSESLPHIDWTLDALHYKPSNRYKIKKLLGHGGAGFLNLNATKTLLNDISEFGPDLIISDGEYIGWHLKTYGGLWNDRESNPCRYLTTIQDFVEEKINICDTAGFIAMDKIALEILKMNGNFDEKLLIDKIGIDRRHVAEIELLRVRI